MAAVGEIMKQPTARKPNNDLVDNAATDLHLKINV
jgi:hypothetical protein